MLAACVTPPGKGQHPDISFMFDEHTVNHFDYPFEDDSSEIVERLIRYSEDESMDLIGISRFILGHHPTMYILYFEDRAIVNFFYWGKNVGKGYITYGPDAPYRMVTEFENRGLCEPFDDATQSIWGFHVSRRSDGNWLICNEPFFLPAFKDEMKPDVSRTPFIGKYFSENFGNRIVWNHYTYGK